MIVVADTSPLNYLLLIGEIGLLPALFGNVVVPQSAVLELQHPNSPSVVRAWTHQPPAWLQVRSVSFVTNPLLTSLDPGERDAIQLALDEGIHTVLMDEAAGRRIAEALHLEVRGTLGVLERAAALGKVDLQASLRKLQQTNFRLSPAVLEAFRKRNAE